MLIDLRQLSGIFLICGKTDLRRGIDGLAGVIKEDYQLNPYSRALFLFCGSRKDRFKALYWAGDGFVLLYKRIEDGRLQWPTTQNEVKKLHAKQLERLLTGWGLESTIKPYQPGKGGKVDQKTIQNKQ
ncbi:IS66 family insertion sequence element accessory protein TnpB [Lacticaseibacillus kribbianus]|uniref:IS66 family insertion sequence element accessory protein TnpB n=1 Tax=Lacticaseibacillus kribbianus TaxID=2926292 RepID=UPI001CD41BAD|nr:IS66 family insertion sequence element accessory protein TnpB [Lacticaseibacillus kribbianus]